MASYTSCGGGEIRSSRSSCAPGARAARRPPRRRTFNSMVPSCSCLSRVSWAAQRGVTWCTTRDRCCELCNEAPIQAMAMSDAARSTLGEGKKRSCEFSGASRASRERRFYGYRRGRFYCTSNWVAHANAPRNCTQNAASTSPPWQSSPKLHVARVTPAAHSHKLPPQTKPHPQSAVDTAHSQFKATRPGDKPPRQGRHTAHTASRPDAGCTLPRASQRRLQQVISR